MPMELNMVRYLDNFSGGGRGAASAEYLYPHSFVTFILIHEVQKFYRERLCRFVLVSQKFAPTICTPLHVAWNKFFRFLGSRSRANKE